MHCQEYTLAPAMSTAEILRCIDNIAAGKKAAKLVFSPGKYFFSAAEFLRDYNFISNHDYAARSMGLYFRNIDSLEIEGNGAELIFADRSLAFAFVNCRNINLSRISIDYGCDFIVSGKTLDASGDCVDLQLDPESRVYEDDGKLFFFDDEWGKLRTSVKLMQFDSAKRCFAHNAVAMSSCRSGEILSAGVIRLTGLKKVPAAGERIVMKTEARINPAVLSSGCREFFFNEVTIRHSGAMGFIAQTCRDLKFLRCRVHPAPGREISCSDDALHCVNCGGRIVVKECEFCNQWDDAVNIHGIYSRYQCRNIGGNYAFLESAQFQQNGINRAVAGEKIAFRKPDTLELKHTAEVASVRELNPQYTVVTFTEMLPAEITPGDCVENLDRIPQVEISDCRFYDNFARGVLCTAPGIIAGNYFRTPSSAVYLGGDFNYWFESGAVNGLTVRNNEFDSCGYITTAPVGRAVIDIHPELIAAEAPVFHRNILIDSNRVSGKKYLPLVCYDHADVKIGVNNNE